MIAALLSVIAALLSGILCLGFLTRNRLNYNCEGSKVGGERYQERGMR
jgi:hypothetical protein